MMRVQQLLQLAVMIALLVSRSTRTDALANEMTGRLGLATTSAGQISVICEDYSEHPARLRDHPPILLPAPRIVLHSHSTSSRARAAWGFQNLRGMLSGVT